MSGCNAGCGHCNACTEAWEGHHQDAEPILYCAAKGCGQTIARVSIAVQTTPHHSVVCCSELCVADLLADLDERKAAS